MPKVGILRMVSALLFCPDVLARLNLVSNLLEFRGWHNHA